MQEPLNSPVQRDIVGVWFLLFNYSLTLHCLGRLASSTGDICEDPELNFLGPPSDRRYLWWTFMKLTLLTWCSLSLVLNFNRSLHGDLITWHLAQFSMLHEYVPFWHLSNSDCSFIHQELLIGKRMGKKTKFNIFCDFSFPCMYSTKYLWLK